MDISDSYAVQMRGITKMFGSVCALDHINIDVKKGTIHAMLGENGAGKSTLMNILYGLYHADSGDIYLNGKKVEIKNPRVAIENKIGMVHQHFMLIENFTVLQNIILGSEVVGKFGVLDMKKAKKEILDIIDKYGLKVDPDVKIENISVGMQQRVEILKALYRGADLLILDEPTAVLTPQETEELIKTMHSLVDDGKTIIIITHKLKEIKMCSSVCTIVRKGKYIDTVDVQDVQPHDLAHMMVGRAVKLVVNKEPANPSNVVFEIKNLTVENSRKIEMVKNLSLSIRKGEILGIAGIAGNGQNELIEAITCLTKVKSGHIIINGNRIENTSPGNVIKNKISTIHADRHKRSCILNFSVYENVALEKYKDQPFSKKGFINKSKVKEFANSLIKEYNVHPEDCADKLFRKLSGGNQQKVVIGREIANDPDLLIAVQPTRGLDVGAIEYVHKVLVQQRDLGKAILLISLELDEIMSVADRIAVISEGEIVETFNQGEVNEETLGLLMAGGENNESKDA